MINDQSGQAVEFLDKVMLRVSQVYTEGEDAVFVSIFICSVLHAYKQKVEGVQLDDDDVEGIACILLLAFQVLIEMTGLKVRDLSKQSRGTIKDKILLALLS